MNHCVRLLLSDGSLLLRSVAGSTGQAISHLIIIVLLVIYKFRRIHLVDLLCRSYYLLNALRPSWIKLGLIDVIIHKWVLIVLLVLRHSMRMTHTQMETPIIIQCIIRSVWTGCTVHVELLVVFILGWCLLLPGSGLNIGLAVGNHFLLILLILLYLLHFAVWRSRNTLITSKVLFTNRVSTWFGRGFSGMLITSRIWITNQEIISLLGWLLLILYLINLLLCRILMLLHLTIGSHELRLLAFRQVCLWLAG